MRLSFLDSLPLNVRERKIITWVFGASAGLSILLVSGVWAAHALSSNAERASDGENSPTLSLQNAKTLLSIDMRAHRTVADNFIAIQQPEKAIPHLQRILAVEPGNKEALLDLATGFLAAGRYTTALELYEKLAKSNPGDSLHAIIAARKGLALFHTGRFEQSAHVLDRCLNQTPECAEALCYRGQVAAALNPQSSIPEQYYRKAHAIAPRYTEPLYQLARYLMNKPSAKREDYLEARELLITLLEIEPLDPKAHSRLGMIYYYLGQNELARKSYTIALALNPGDYNTRYNLGELWFSEDKKKEALREFQHTLQENPAHLQANFRTGLILLDNNMFNEAIQALEKARQQAPGNIRILFQLAVAYERKGMPERAKAIYQRILDLDALNEVARQKMRLLSAVSAEGEHHM